MATQALSPNEELAVKNKLLQNDGRALGPKEMQAYEDIARREGITLVGLTILGGKIYINQTGLDQKIANLCKKNKWVKAGQTCDVITESRDEDGQYRCGFRATVTLFDNKGFGAAIKELAAVMTKDLLAETAERFTYRFTSEGWAGHESVKMGTLKNPDYLRMTAATRATNRAKRGATGTGLTSVEEIGTELAPAPPAEPGAIERIPANAMGMAGEVVEGELLNATSQPETTIRKVWLKWGPQDREAYLTGFYQLFEKELVKKTNAKFDKTKKLYTVPGPYVHEVYELARQHNVEIVELTKPAP